MEIVVYSCTSGKLWNDLGSPAYTTHMQHYQPQIPLFQGFSRSQNVNKEIIFRKREYQEYITPQNFGSGVFFCVNYDKINIIIKRKQV